MKKITTFILTILMSAVLLTACSTGNTAQEQQAASTLQANNTASQQEPTAAGNDTIATASTAVNSPDQSTGNQSASTSEKVFTKDELAKYDGQNGNPAYIAVNGVVYNVTNVREWRNGQHKGGYRAGADLTEAFKTASPHDSSIFNGIPVVGKYAG